MSIRACVCVLRLFFCLFVGLIECNVCLHLCLNRGLAEGGGRFRWESSDGLRATLHPDCWDFVAYRSVRDHRRANAVKS
jgi:hypothetical protein